ncbi:MAG: glutathione S-transferase family protein [Methylobacteriaceae bacterium]|nr:glutathione S-transferase family protein [Methylobacteriaceae bacterium]
MAVKLILANKAYSSWSMRPWILLRHFEIPFEDVVIPLDRPETRDAILKYAPSGKCPSLQDGSVSVWESLAIIEHVAEAYPEKPIWPAAKDARGLARSLSAEMHAGFQALRTQCPMNLRRQPKAIPLSAETLADVARIEAAWGDARQRFGGKKSFLFGEFGAADAMFAPVVNRFHVYDIKVAPTTRAYMDAIMDLPAWKAWEKDAFAEPWRIEKYESV